jgi:hypothetical protein
MEKIMEIIKHLFRICTIRKSHYLAKYLNLNITRKSSISNLLTPYLLSNHFMPNLKVLHSSISQIGSIVPISSYLPLYIVR